MMKDPFGVCLEPECNDVEMPPTTEMIENLLTSGKDIIKGVIAGESLLVSDAVYETRMTICGGCEFFARESQRCGKCGCYMEAKAKFNKTTCPIGKW